MSAKIRRLRSVLLAGGLLLIAIATLFPFVFHFHLLRLSAFFSRFEYFPSSPLDFPKNILLFLPFGTGLAFVLEADGFSVAARHWLLLLAGFLVSLLVETLQIFLPHRTPNISDLIANSIGALCGGCLTQGIRSPSLLLRAVCTRIAAWSSTTFLLTYSGVALGVSLLLMFGLAPRGWDSSYKISLGNESDGKWPWRGFLRDVVLFESGITSETVKQFLLASFPINSPSAIAGYYHLNNAKPVNCVGNLPDLEWIGPAHIENGGAVLSERSWLRSSRSCDEYAKNVNKSQQFTVAFTAATFDRTQPAFPRVLTFSADDENINFAIAQHRDTVEFRWRSLLSGDGTTPQLYFENVFALTNEFLSVIRFQRNVLTLSTSGRPDVEVCLGPEVGFEALIRDSTQWLVYVSPFSFLSSTILFALFISVPCVFFLVTRQVRPFDGILRRRRFESAILLLLPLAIETLVWLYTGCPFRFRMVAVELLVFALVFFAVSRIFTFLGRVHFFSF